MAGTNGVASLSEQIVGVLKGYNGEVAQAIYNEAKDCATALKKQLAWESPERTGRYSKGWSVKEVKSGTHSSFVVYNKTDGQLTHLLEKGHKGPNGSPKYTPAYPHIQPLAEAWKREFISRCEEACKR